MYYFLAIGLVILIAFLFFKRNENKTLTAATAAFQAKVKANPSAYFVSQGGTKPDPVVVASATDASSASQGQ